MAPRTIEVAREGWAQALNEFSAIHEGWLVSLDILSSEVGAQPEIANLPFFGATFEDTHGGTITVTAGPSAVEQITHTIRAPIHLWIERTDAGADAALAIESADGAKAILRLKTPALPETVDGVARWP